MLGCKDNYRRQRRFTAFRVTAPSDSGTCPLPQQRAFRNREPPGGGHMSPTQRAPTAQVTVLMAEGAVRDRGAAGRFLFLSTVGNHGLLPLLFGPAEYPIKARNL